MWFWHDCVHGTRFDSAVGRLISRLISLNDPFNEFPPLSLIVHWYLPRAIILMIIIVAISVTIYYLIVIDRILNYNFFKLIYDESIHQLKSMNDFESVSV